MKITSFTPLILTKDAEAILQLFEELGFEKRHQPTGTSALGNNYAAFRLADSNGFHLNVSQSSAPRDRDAVAINMNVDDFDEAYRLLLDHGFTDIQGGNPTDTGSAKAAYLSSPSGFGIVLVQHIK